MSRTVQCCGAVSGGPDLGHWHPGPGPPCLPSRSALPHVLQHIRSVRVPGPETPSESTALVEAGEGAVSAHRSSTATTTKPRVHRVSRDAARAPWCTWAAGCLAGPHLCATGTRSAFLSPSPFGFFFCMFLLKKDKTCSSPHDCGCFGERYWSVMYSRCNSEHCAVRQTFRLLL